jgi:hypothetical protein
MPVPKLAGTPDHSEPASLKSADFSERSRIQPTRAASVEFEALTFYIDYM